MIEPEQKGTGENSQETLVQLRALYQYQAYLAEGVGFEHLAPGTIAEEEGLAKGRLRGGSNKRSRNKLGCLGDRCKR